MQTTVTCAEIEKRLLIALHSRGSRNQANAFSYVEPLDESHFPWLIANVYAGAHETLRASLSFKQTKKKKDELYNIVLPFARIECAYSSRSKLQAVRDLYTHKQTKLTTPSQKHLLMGWSTAIVSSSQPKAISFYGVVIAYVEVALSIAMSDSSRTCFSSN